MRDPLKCGECGCETFRIRHVRPATAPRAGGGGEVGGESQGLAGHLQVICTGCKDTSIITATRPGIQLTGNLCGGWYRDGT